MANGTKELNTSPITIEDEIDEFSEKPVQGKTLYKKLKELEEGSLPDTSEASGGDVLTLDEDKKPTWGEVGGGAFIVNLTNDDTFATDKTAKEIFDAACVGIVIFIMDEGADGISAMLVSSVFYAEGGGYYVQISNIDGTFTLTADSDNATTWTLQS